MKQVLIGAAALAVVALFEGLFHTLAFFSERRREELRRRLQAGRGGGDGAALSLLRQGRLSAIPALDELLRAMPLLGRLERLIEQSQAGTTVARLLVVSAVAAAAGAALGLAVGGPALAFLLLSAAGAAPTLRLSAMRARRDRKLSEQLPSALDMMARSLRAGHALTAAFKLVASEMPAPINLEFGRAYEEQNLGMSFDRAVLQMTARAPGNRDLKIFAVSVIVQKETGGNLVEILEKIAETIRLRYQFYGKLAALCAEGRLSGVVLGVLPIFTGLLLAVINPRYATALVSSPMGRGFLIYAVASWFLGLIWLRAMGKVEL
jgi:tight adherence protein B